MRDKPPFCWCHDEAIPDEVFGQPSDGQEPDAHETYVTSWDELLYRMTGGEMGTKPPESPRRYEPPQTPRHCGAVACASLGPLHECAGCGLFFCERHCDYQTTWYGDMPVYVCYDCLRAEVDYPS